MKVKNLNKNFFNKRLNSKREGYVSHKDDDEYDEYHDDYWDELYDEGVREAKLLKIKRSKKRNNKEEQ